MCNLFFLKLFKRFINTIKCYSWWLVGPPLQLQFLYFLLCSLAWCWTTAQFWNGVLLVTLIISWVLKQHISHWLLCFSWTRALLHNDTLTVSLRAHKLCLAHLHLMNMTHVKFHFNRIRNVKETWSTNLIGRHGDLNNILFQTLFAGI